MRVEGWRRGDLFDATGLPWVSPSPNLRSVDAALIYPGLALLEATNVSVGRGTAQPFEQVGAPWASAMARASPPRSASWGCPACASRRRRSMARRARAPSRASCREGVTVQVDDRRRFEPGRTRRAIAAALRRLHPEAWDAKNVMTLLGHAPTFAALLRGDSADAMAAGWQPGLAAFLAVRKKYLLYPE